MESSNNNEINLPKADPDQGGIFSERKWRGKRGREMRTHPRITPNLLLSPFQVRNENWELYSGVASGRQASRSGYLLVGRVGRVCCQGGSLWHSTGHSFECTLKLCSPGGAKEGSNITHYKLETMETHSKDSWRSDSSPLRRKELGWTLAMWKWSGMNRPKKEENTHLNVCST